MDFNLNSDTIFVKHFVVFARIHKEEKLLHGWRSEKIAIGIGLLLIPIIVLITLFSGGSGGKDELNLSESSKKYSKNQKYGQKKGSEYNTSTGGTRYSDGYNSSRDSSHSISYSNGKSSNYSYASRNASGKKKSPFTKEEIKRVNNEIESASQQLLKVEKGWILAKMSDKSLTAKTREKYRFKLIKSYGKGVDAMKNKNYAKALKEFRKSLKDPMASPVTKSMAYMYMKCAAQKLGDLDLYLLIASAEAELIATEDLSAIGIEKTTVQREWVEKFGKLMGAANDKGKYRELVDERMRKYGASADKRPVIEKTINRQINEYRKHFKEFFKYAN